MPTDKEMLDWLEQKAREPGGLLLHAETKSTGRRGLGLGGSYPRSLRSAITLAMTGTVIPDGVQDTPPAEPIYVECCQCDHCQHTGINDSPSDKAACNRCDWRGAAPQEDRCPGCGDTGTMARACPECGGHYRCVAEGNVDAKGEPVPLGVDSVDGRKHG